MQEEIKLQSSQAEELHDDFNWEEYAKDCPTQFRKSNNYIKTKEGDKIFCKQDYAWDLYNLIENHWQEREHLAIIESAKVYSGIITSIQDNIALVDINYRTDVLVDLSKESEEITHDLNVGSKVSVQLDVIERDENLVQLIGSIGGAYSKIIFDQLLEQTEEQDTAYPGKIISMIEDAGYVVEIKGVNCFMPGSLAGINKLHDFSSIIGKELYVVPVSYSESRGTIVVSHRKYLQALIPDAIDTLKSTIESEPITTLNGHVTGTTKYGVFVEFNNCLTGMIHVNDLDAATLKTHSNRELKPGTSIDFMIKHIVNKNKIILTQKKDSIVVEDNPWDDIQERYKIPQVVVGKIKSVKDYGIFIEIEKGVVGLLHISDIPNSVDLAKIDTGGEISVVITRIDTMSRRVFLVKKDFTDL